MQVFSPGKTSWNSARVCVRAFSTLVPRGQTRTRVCMRVFSTLMPRLNENKNCMRVDKSWEARVCMRVFSTLMPRSNENKNCMRVDESWEARVCMRVFSTRVPRSNENKSCMRVDERREFAWEFSQLSCPGQTRTRIARELTGYYPSYPLLSTLSWFKFWRELMTVWPVISSQLSFDRGVRLCMNFLTRFCDWLCFKT
jgi:hypothetical protein